MSDLKNVVIVGLGPAGVASAAALSKALPPTHRVIALTEFDYGFWPISSLRSSVVPGWEDKSSISVAGLFPKGSRHIVLSGTKALRLDLSSVTVDIPHPEHNLGTEISFDYAVIATGATYAWPMRPAPGAKKLEDIVNAFKGLQADIAAAESVLVVGGGATGVEYAGEVKEHFPNKQVTLVVSSAALFDGPGFNPKLGRSLQSQLEALGVKIKFNTRLDIGATSTGPIKSRAFSFADGSSVEADYVFLATGIKPNSGIVAGLGPDSIDASGAIKVLPTLQLVAESTSHIFAIGDVTDRPESKQAATAGNHIPIVTANIVALIKGSTVLKEHKVPGGPLILITIGSQGGAAQLFGFFLGGWFAWLLKSRTLMISMFVANYPALK